jgi:ribosome-binding factor A
MKGRSARVEDLLRAELARILLRNVKDPRLGMVTVSYLRVSADLSHAEVGISALGSESDREASLRTLVRAQGYVRRELARNIRLRRVPELSFKLDRGAEHSQKISQILETLHDDTERS